MECCPLRIRAHTLVDCVWNVMAHAQQPDFVFRRNGRVHLNRRGRQCSRLLAAELCASAVVILDTPCSEVVWRVRATQSIRQFPLHFPSRASPCAITFQLDSTHKMDAARGGHHEGWHLSTKLHVSHCWITHHDDSITSRSSYFLEMPSSCSPRAVDVATLHSQSCLTTVS
jgi:hypothetical protein